ncbi:MAG: amino acid permease [Peptococcaceae bacterium]|jgi:APA family basic amino acid/polyamine antiporter|nr:amino acid permease [Peptococcaceae bacterium]
MNLFRTKPIKDLLRGEEESGLKKSMGALDLTALGIGAIIGTGIFVLTGVAAAQYAGPGLVFSFLVSGVAAGLAALVYAELASMIPVAGSAYTYSYAALGEFTGWLVGWNLMLSYVVAVAAVAIGWASYFTDLTHSLGLTLPRVWTTAPSAGGVLNLPAIAIIAAVAFLAVRGTRQSAEANRGIVALKITVILFFIALGSFYVKAANWHPFLPFGPAGIFNGAAIIFFAYIGFDAVATAAEETDNPEKNVPIGIIASLAVSTLLYIAVTVVLTGLVPYTALNTASPVATGLIYAGFPWAGAIISVGALAGITSVLLVMTYAVSRILLAMARDGLLPPLFGLVHPRFRTPYAGVLTVTLVAAVLGAFLSLGLVAQLANIGVLTAFIVNSAGVMVLRRTKPHWPRPFKVPLYPYTPVLSVLFCLYLIFSLPRLTWLQLALWLGAGIAVYFAYSYRHSLLQGPAGPRTKAVPAPAAKFRPGVGEKEERP